MNNSELKIGASARFLKVQVVNAPETCPICGADVPRNAKACPECGACEKSGWSDETAGDGLDLPDDEFDYGEFLKREFGGPEIKPAGMKWFCWIAAVVALLAFLLLWLIPFASHHS